jgi:hypothetical protein
MTTNIILAASDAKSDRAGNSTCRGIVKKRGTQTWLRFHPNAANVPFTIFAVPHFHWLHFMRKQAVEGS